MKTHNVLSPTALVLAGVVLVGVSPRSHAAQDQVTAAIPMNTLMRFGPFANNAGTDKVFSLAGLVNIFQPNTNVNVRFCWNPAANAAIPIQCSQWVTINYAMAGLNLPINTGPYWLPNACPRTVWVEIQPDMSIDIDAKFSHVCNNVPNPPGATQIIPSYHPSVPTVSEWGLIIMGLLLLTAGTIVIARRRAKESVLPMA
ncbi:MAG: hypothetical protein HBSAPP02_29140 [Phycisphaerae bacterium]|nr:MAG: IPTL-CTERM sorting domain-containing protein [Planctomycetia bacterium]RIK68440.1 MAG: hypothetical protein DCC66_10300 [Planctomycetota bacterium]GJQ27882.1 MAG: hypothetical protein HBSAPP02_29140 [Phycisphaerae bacterium]